MKKINILPAANQISGNKSHIIKEIKKWRNKLQIEETLILFFMNN